MLNQLQIKRYSHRLQVEFRTLSKICKKLYYKYAPSRLTHRRNASLVKVPDYEIIALLVWQAEEGISSQRRFARCWGLCGLSRSRRVCSWLCNRQSINPRCTRSKRADSQSPSRRALYLRRWRLYRQMTARCSQDRRLYTVDTLSEKYEEC